MNKVFEKIIEKLEELDVHFDNDYFSSNREAMVLKKEAIEIVKKEAEEYNNDQINQLAMMYAKNLVQYGIDITKVWDTATQQAAALNQAYMRGRQEERDRFEQCNNGWISVKEMLPEKAGSYLAIGKSGGAIVTRWYKPSKFHPNGHFGGNCSDYIRYWMPRPEPPQPYQPKGE